MADKKLSQLTAATAVNGPDALYLLQNLTDKRVTVDTLFRNSGNIRFAGNIYYDGANAQTLTDVGTISLTTPITNLVITQGGGELKLPRATVEGAVKFITLTHTDSSSGYFISSNISYDGTANILFNKTGDSVLLHYVNAAWRIAGISNFQAMSQIPDASTTGNVGFNDVTVEGNGNEAGGGGLNLSPGPTLTANLQYFKVRGGDNETHLHLDTGNYINFDAYFGDDNQFLKLEKNHANVEIGTNTHRWVFGADSKLSIPGILQIKSGSHNALQLKSNTVGVVTHNCNNGQIFYHTSANANWTVNLVNLNLTDNHATAVSIVIAQSSVGYYPNALQIAGVEKTIEWQANILPTPSVNRTDVVTFNIFNNSGTYVVLGQITGF